MKAGADPLSDGTHVLTLASARGLGVGSIIKIEQENDAAYLRETGNDHLLSKLNTMNADGQYLRRMIAEVTKVEGDKVTIKTATPYAFTAGKAEVSVVSGASLEGIELGGFKVTSDLGTPDKYNFTNPYTANGFADPGKNSAVEVSNVVGLKMYDIVAKNVVSTAFEMSSIYGAVVDKLTADGAWNKGGEGNGYAFLIKTAFNNSFDNLTDKDMRHSFITGSFTPEHYNDIHVLSTNRDINFHGSADSHNAIRVDSAVLDYRIEEYSHPAVAAGNFRIHPNSTIDANDVTFKYLVGSNSMDIVHAHDSGARLLGNGDKDELYGGRGGDYLSGGTHQDILKGAGGRDTFVFSRSFGQDQVLDFVQGKGSASDTLDLAKTGITSRDGLSVRFVDGDAQIALGGGDILTLEGISQTEFKTINIKYDAAAAKGVSLTAIGADFGFAGTSRNDKFILKTGYVEDSPDLLGLNGTDTLALISGSMFNSADLGRTVGMDVLDVTGTPTTKAARITLDNDFVNQSDKDQVTIKVGKQGMTLKTSGISDWNDVRIEGSGKVELSSSGVAVSSAGGAINVLGGSGVDKIKGGGGKDTINGGKNKDVLEGGKGDDSFVFSSPFSTSNVDTINDFSNSRGNNDRFVLENDIFKGLKTGTLASDAFLSISKKGAVKAADGKDRILYDKGNGDLYFDQDGSGSKYKPVKFAQVDDNTSLSASAFFIV